MRGGCESTSSSFAAVKCCCCGCCQVPGTASAPPRAASDNQLAGCTRAREGEQPAVSRGGDAIWLGARRSRSGACGTSSQCRLCDRRNLYGAQRVRRLRGSSQRTGCGNISARVPYARASVSAHLPTIVARTPRKRWRTRKLRLPLAGWWLLLYRATTGPSLGNAKRPTPSKRRTKQTISGSE